MKVWIFVDRTFRHCPHCGAVGSNSLEKRDGAFNSYVSKTSPNTSEKLAHTEKLTQSSDLVVLPDLYPNGYAKEYKHENLEKLRDVQTQLVKQDLQKYPVQADADSHIARFYASALKHDMEVLLLAATSQLQSRLKMSNSVAGANRRKSRIKTDLLRTFRRHLKHREIVDSILRRPGRGDCPRPWSMWIGEKTGVGIERWNSPCTEESCITRHS